MNIPKVGTAVLITWLDSTSDRGWQYKEPRKNVKPIVRTIKSRCWIVGVSPIAVATASHICAAIEDDLEGHLNPLSIPLGCIIDVKEEPVD